MNILPITRPNSKSKTIISVTGRDYLLMKHEGLTEKQAEKELQEINDEKMTNQEVLGFPTEEDPKPSKKEYEDKKEKKEE